MDSLTHGLFPFLAGKFFGRSRTECAALLLGGLAPDFDVFIMWIPLFFNTTLPFTHRGITHTVIFGFLTAAIVLFLASRAYFQNLTKHAFRTDIALSMTPKFMAFVYIGLLLHLFLDSLTTYGIALLYPFSTHRFSAELFFYIDQYLLAISAVLTGYMIILARRINLPPEKRSKHMQGAYIKMFCVLVAAIVIFGGIRYYEKGISADYFKVSQDNVFPTFSPTEWTVVDRNAGKIYEFNSLKKTVISESIFSGEFPNRMRRLPSSVQR